MKRPTPMSRRKRRSLEEEEAAGEDGHHAPHIAGRAQAASATPAITQEYDD